MVGSEQVELFEGKRRRKPLKKIRLGTAILLVAVVGLASLSVSLWYLADHYHDSKYRAQYVLVASLWNSMYLVSGGIDGMMDSSQPDYDRLDLAEYAIMNIGAAHDSARAIEVMYPENSEEATVFATIERALTQTERDVERYKSDLSSALDNNRSHAANGTVNTLFQTLGLRMDNLSALVFLGIDDTRDWYADPYSLVKRLDLAAVEEASEQLEATGIELARLIVF